jgi:Tfp pilus assembly major pilin PilA
MDSNSSQNEALYRAAVGENKAGYYLPLFQRFEQGGSRASWNWPAFFVTFFWLLYRRMYGLALGYLLAWPFAAAIVFTVVSVVLGPLAGAVFYWFAVVGVQLVAVPMFANAVYHWHVRKRIDKLAASAPSHEALLQRVIGQASTANVAVMVGVAAVFGVAVVGILAAIAIPAYQDYTIRAQVTNGLILAADVKASMADEYAASGRWPAKAEDPTVRFPSRYVSSIGVSDGVILIRYGKTAHKAISGRTLSLHPRVEGDQIVKWACGYAAGGATQTDIAPRYVPHECRAPEPEHL